MLNFYFFKKIEKNFNLVWSMLSFIFKITKLFIFSSKCYIFIRTVIFFRFHNIMMLYSL